MVFVVCLVWGLLQCRNDSFLGVNLVFLVVPPCVEIFLHHLHIFKSHNTSCIMNLNSIPRNTIFMRHT